MDTGILIEILRRLNEAQGLYICQRNNEGSKEGRESFTALVNQLSKDIKKSIK